MRLIETIRITDGRAHLLPFHIRRMEAACREAGYGSAPQLTADMLTPPEALTVGTVKCRIVYGRKIESVEFAAYEPRPLTSLLIVEAGDIDYHLKAADRSALDALHRTAQSRGYSDALITRHGMLTDTTYANIVCHTADGRLLTPDTPLLAGVMRQSLIERGELTPAPLSVADLREGNPQGITAVSIINAMLPPGTIRPLSVISDVFAAETDVNRKSDE